MRIGFGAPVAGAWATPGYLTAFARRAEDAGYASLWSFQRLLVPEGSEMEPVYRSVLDPIVALGYVAASTSRIRLGVATICLPFISPVVLAKQAATVDVLSGGRLDLGLGIGWMPEEFAATGASTTRRGARAAEYLAVLRTLWADEVSSFDGEFYTIPAGRQDPRPVQRPGPPVLLGGMSRPAMDRAGRIADGWITSDGRPSGMAAWACRIPSKIQMMPKPMRSRRLARGSAVIPAAAVPPSARADGAHSRTLTHRRASRKKISRATIP